MGHRQKQKNEYTDCWRKIDSIGSHDGHANSANAPVPIWKLMTDAFNEISVGLAIQN